MTNRPTDDIWSTVIHDMTRRREFGIAKYGATLSTNNGRDPVQDAYEEALDLAVYLKQAMLVARGERTEVVALLHPMVSLTKREGQILGLIAKGLTNPEIARTLGTRYNTVKNQITGVFRKVGCGNRTEAALYAHKVGLL
jgi:DNA-binding NarL/FixJ family response regulator